MIKEITRQTGLFFLLLFIQLLILNHIEFSGYINGYIYVLFILTLPLNTPKWMLLFAGFAIGFSVDLFFQTLGIHTLASLCMAYIRPFLLNVISPREGYENGMRPDVNLFGFSWFIKYAFILVLAHHLVLFYTEVFVFHQFFHTMLRVIASTLFTMLLLILSQMLILKR